MLLVSSPVTAAAPARIAPHLLFLPNTLLLVPASSTRRGGMVGLGQSEGSNGPNSQPGATPALGAAGANLGPSSGEELPHGDQVRVLRLAHSTMDTIRMLFLRKVQIGGWLRSTGALSGPAAGGHGGPVFPSVPSDAEATGRPILS